ncbi:hypothetical protein AMTR_s00151p00093180 [Amborella trichopoda]|uniref:Uncharacterized protein n=1 Tax=Amborella trichopoda TaxID=13333 RepID=W1NJ22_AMBTC|nr:hypothetical protein AMTR_s00151p00093180 [Amborella trichopoda]
MGGHPTKNLGHSGIEDPIASKLFEHNNASLIGPTQHSSNNPDGQQPLQRACIMVQHHNNKRRSNNHGMAACFDGQDPQQPQRPEQTTTTVSDNRSPPLASYNSQLEDP